MARRVVPICSSYSSGMPKLSRSMFSDLFSEFTAMAMCSTRLIFMAVSSGNRDAAVHRIDLTGHHARFIGSKEYGHVGDVGWFDQAQQMGICELGQGGVAGDQFADALCHGGGRRDRVDPDFAGGEFDCHGACDCGDRALGGSVAVA